jgi:hypothetical protein
VVLVDVVENVNFRMWEFEERMLFRIVPCGKVASIDACLSIFTVQRSVCIWLCVSPALSLNDGQACNWSAMEQYNLDEGSEVVKKW